VKISLYGSRVLLRVSRRAIARFWHHHPDTAPTARRESRRGQGQGPGLLPEGVLIPAALVRVGDVVQFFPGVTPGSSLCSLSMTTRQVARAG